MRRRNKTRTNRRSVIVARITPVGDDALVIDGEFRATPGEFRIVPQDIDAAAAQIHTHPVAGGEQCEIAAGGRMFTTSAAPG